MNISYRWLSDYLDLSHISVDQLAEIMTEIGLEVEGVRTTESIQGGLQGVVVGKVLTCSSHPNADRLSLTTVDVGQDEPLQIVCGAPNVQKGQLVPVAMVGTTLYDAEGNGFTIKKGKIRGEYSYGMICAEDELGISNNHDGIMVLPDNWHVGQNLSHYIDTKTDHIFDIELTPNRADATNHLGIAKDISAYLRVHDMLSTPLQVPETSKILDSDKALSIDIEVDEAICPRYAGIILNDIEVKESPEWIKERLTAIGISPKNNIVDITNFVLHEMGQPLHAFDYDQIKGKAIKVHHLPKGTTFTALDGAEYELQGEEVMIYDAQKTPLCMGGIMGSQSSSVTAQTKTIFLESAFFDAKSIRKASMAHQLRTDAAKVFEKGVDPNRVRQGLARAVDLLQEYASAQIASTVYDSLPGGIPKPKVRLRFDYVRTYVGVPITNEEIKTIIKALDIDIVKEEDDIVILAIPTNKPDVLREVDVIEEIIRIYGLDQIPSDGVVTIPIQPSQYPSAIQIKGKISQNLVGMGFMEAMSLSLVSLSWYDGIYPPEQLVRIQNTSNKDLDGLRPDMVTSALQNVGYNIRRQRKDVALFEFGRTFIATEEEYKESRRLSIVLSGQSLPINWLAPNQNPANFYTAKSVVTKLLGLLGIEKAREENYTEDANYIYALSWHLGNQRLATCGKISAERRDLFEIDQEVFFVDIDWDKVLKLSKGNEIKVSERSKYPAVHRDLALVMDQEVSFFNLKQTILAAAKGILHDVVLIDHYENESHIGQGKKSLAIRFVLEHPDRTLSEKEIDKIIQSLLKKVNKKHGAELRA